MQAARPLKVSQHDAVMAQAPVVMSKVTDKCNTDLAAFELGRTPDSFLFPELALTGDCSTILANCNVLDVLLVFESILGAHLVACNRVFL